jgi:hypothetical protein
MEFCQFSLANEHAGAEGDAGRMFEDFARVFWYPRKNPRRVNIMESTGGVNEKTGTQRV